MMHDKGMRRSASGGVRSPRLTLRPLLPLSPSILGNLERMEWSDFSECVSMPNLITGRSKQNATLWGMAGAKQLGNILPRE